MKHRILILGMCLVMAACSTAGTRTVIGSIGTQASPTSATGQPPLPPSPPGSWRRDIGITDEQGPLPDHGCVNSYGNSYRGGWVYVCAGGKVMHGLNGITFVRGAVFVNTNPDPRASGPISQVPPDTPTNEYDAPNSPTWVQIASVNGDIVNLRRQDGSTLTFDLQTSRFG